MDGDENFSFTLKYVSWRFFVKLQCHTFGAFLKDCKTQSPLFHATVAVVLAACEM